LARCKFYMWAVASPQLWGWTAIALGAGFLVWLLSPILSPFLLAAILAYICDPLVERLTRRRIPRSLAVVLVLLLVIGAFVCLVLGGLPVFFRKPPLLLKNLPAFGPWLTTTSTPWFPPHLAPALQPAPNRARQL